MVQMVIKGNVKERHLVEAGIPHCSLQSFNLFANDTAALMNWVQERVSRDEGLYFVDSIGRVVTGSHTNQIVIKRETCTRVSIDWGDRRELAVDNTKTAAALITYGRGHKKQPHQRLTAKI